MIGTFPPVWLLMLTWLSAALAWFAMWADAWTTVVVVEAGTARESQPNALAYIARYGLRKGLAIQNGWLGLWVLAACIISSLPSGQPLASKGNAVNGNLRFFT